MTTQTTEELIKLQQRARIQNDMGPAGFYTDPFTPGIAPATEEPGGVSAEALPVDVTPPPTPVQADEGLTQPPPIVEPSIRASKSYVEIDAELGLPPRETGLSTLPDEDAGWFEVMGAAWSKTWTEFSALDNYNAKERAIVTDILNQLPEAEQDRLRDTLKPGSRTSWPQATSAILEAAARDAEGPDGAEKWAAYPLSLEALREAAAREINADLDEAQAILDQPGGWLPEFAGSAAAGILDPVNLTLTVVAPGSTFLRKLVAEAALNGAAEAAALPRRYRAAETLDRADPNPVADIGFGMLFGGAFYAGAAGLGKGFRALQSRVEARNSSIRETQPEGVDRIDHEHAVEAAEAELRGDQTPQERLGSCLIGGAKDKTAPAGTLGDIVSDPKPGLLPPASAGGVVDAAEWGPIRNGIFAGESGGDYNALFGYQNRKGGKFSNIKLTEMTVDQAIAFSDPSGPYGQWVKSQIGRVATPMGAYQIVGTTLRGLKRDLGLKGDEVMTEEFQEFLGQQIYLRQGTGAWEGYRGPRTNYTPGHVDGPAPPMGTTSRGYTGKGQVAVGDDMRIDVEYEVVDYRSLVRASGDLQPRDRSRINSDEWIAATAARLDPAQLMPSPTADRGTPVVGPDNVIESGNGRSMAIARAYERHPDRAQAYRGAIEAAGYQIPEGVEQPVLIARRKTNLTPDQRRQMVVDAQDSGVAQMTPTEVARATAQNLRSPILSRLDPSSPLTSDANGGFVRAALATLPRSARNAMFDPGGALNAHGQRQLREAIFARAWPDPDILSRYTESAPAELKSLVEALETAAPSWAALRADIEAGLVNYEMDIGAYVLDAMRLIGAARELAQKQGMPIARALAELVEEVDLMEGAISPLTVALVRKMWKGGRAAPADEIAAFLSRYADEARKAGAVGSMFDAPGPRDVLRTIDPETFGSLPEDFGQARGFARAGSEAPPEAVARPVDEGFDTGAQSAEAELVHTEIEAELRSPQIVGAVRSAKDFAEARAAVSEFQGQPLRNEATGIEAVVSRNALDKMLSRSAVGKSTTPGLHALAVANVDQLFRKAKLGWTKPDRTGDTNIAAIHRYFVPLRRPGGPPAMVKLTVKQDARQGRPNPLYTVEAIEFVEGSSAVKWVDAAAAADTGTSPKAIRPAEDVMNMARRVDDFNSKALGANEGHEAASDILSATLPAGTRDMAPARPSDAADGAINFVSITQDQAAGDLARIRGELGEFAETEIDLPDGTRARAGEILDDLDADRTAEAVLQACGLSTNGAST